MASAASPGSLSSSSQTLAPLPGVAFNTERQENSMSPTTTQSLTSKQWVIPPRPKPGRKPATDTPPTKRKAQNRAAQRAFRERRAAKVGELEDQIDEVMRDHQAEVDGMRSQVEILQQSNTSLKERLNAHENSVRLLQLEIGGWRAHCNQLEDQAKVEHRCRLALESELAVSRGQAVHLPPRASKANIHLHQHVSSTHAPEQAYHTPQEIALGCGKCSLEQCQCLEDALNIEETAEERHELIKRSATPAIEGSNPGKRLKLDTTRQSALPDPSNASLPLSDLPIESGGTDLPRPAESCGFCQEGSTCPCAELAAEREPSQFDHGSRLPSPPREESEALTSSIAPTPALINNRRLKAPSSCMNKPGTCTQCQNDTNSKRFCQSLAAARTAATAPSPVDRTPGPINTVVPCAAGQACCRISSALRSASGANANTSTELDFTTPASRCHNSGTGTNTIYSTSQAVTGPVMSCADAFSMLSKHEAFDNASKDYGEWLPQLATVPGGRSEGSATGPTTPQSTTPGAAPSGQVPARTAFDIEAASVMGVLRFFDRRFGREM